MKYLFLSILLLLSIQAKSQMKADGYVGMMPVWYYLDQPDMHMWESVVHNRLNLSYDFSPSVIGVAQFRNRLIWGKTVREISGYPSLLEEDQGFLDMSFNLASGQSSVLNLTIDRLWLDFYMGKLQLRIGRQRINWGQSMIWNPNDIFNAWSFFDFDYPERPAIDGVRLQLYTGMTSEAEAVVKIDRHNRKTIAARYRFNTGSYNWQLLGGRLNDEEWVAGIGWSGHIGDAGFYGENTLLFPDQENQDETLISSVGANYTFKSSLLLQVEGLYSSNLPEKVGSFAEFISGQASVRQLSVSRYSIFASAQYPFTPVFTGSLSLMAFPLSEAFYFGPSFEYSIKPDLYLSTFLNLFVNCTENNENNGKTTDFEGAVRLKWFF
jgi:hypothetical protein